jgi:hypothetical protein
MAASKRNSPPPAPVEVRYSPLHNFSLSLLSSMLMLFGAFYISRSESAPTASAADPRFMLLVVLAFAMAYYAWIGVQRALDRSPQVTIDADGILLGFGRNRRFSWDEVQWVRIYRIAVRPVLQIGFSPVALAGNVLRVSAMSFDDALRPVRGMPGAVAVRDNGLDMRSAAMLDAVRKFRPDLVKS